MLDIDLEHKQSLLAEVNVLPSGGVAVVPLVGSRRGVGLVRGVGLLLPARVQHQLTRPIRYPSFDGANGDAESRQRGAAPLRMHPLELIGLHNCAA